MIKLILAIVLLSTISCGRRNADECRNREQMVLECQVVNTPSYGRPYAQEMCNRSYSAEKCY